MFSHSVCCLFILFMISFAVQKLFSVMKPHLFIFFFVFPAWGDIFDKILLWAMSKILLPMFSSRIFMVSGLIFQSFIHFEFILMCGVRRWSSFIFLCISFQCSQHHLLNKISLVHCVCLLPLSNINWLRVWVYSRALYSVPLICVCVFMLVLCCLDYFGLTVFFHIR